MLGGGPAVARRDAPCRRAETRGILIELGDVFFMAGLEQRNCFRMGFSSIKLEKIDAGVRALAELVRARRPDT